jgi:hypothetical protein
MIQKGNVISLSESADSTKQYVIADRLDDLGHGEGGWLCIEMDALVKKGTDNIDSFDCWRITDRYLEMQIQRGVITITN